MDTVKQEKLTELPNYERTDWFSSVSLKSLNVNMPVVYVSSRVDNKPPNVPVYAKCCSLEIKLGFPAKNKNRFTKFFFSRPFRFVFAFCSFTKNAKICGFFAKFRFNLLPCEAEERQTIRQKLQLDSNKFSIKYYLYF